MSVQQHLKEIKEAKTALLAPQEELGRECVALQEQLAHALHRQGEAEIEAARRVQEQGAAAEELHRRIQELTEERARLTEEANELARERTVLREQLEALARRVAGLEAQMAALEEARQKDERARAASEQRLAEITAALQAHQQAEQELTDLRLAHEALTSAHRRLQDEHRSTLARLHEVPTAPPSPPPAHLSLTPPADEQAQRQAFMETLKRELAASTERLKQEARERVRLAFDPKQ